MELVPTYPIHITSGVKDVEGGFLTRLLLISRKVAR